MLFTKLIILPPRVPKKISQFPQRQNIKTGESYHLLNVYIYVKRLHFPLTLTDFMNFSDSAHLDPKLFDCKVMFSLVWESNVGFSIKAFTKIHMWFFTCKETLVYYRTQNAKHSLKQFEDFNGKLSMYIPGKV